MTLTAPMPARARLRDLEHRTARLQAFQRRHHGETALLVGKGPSLEAFLSDGLSEPVHAVACINETATLTADILAALRDPLPPIPLYAFANDPIDRWVDQLPATLACSFSPVRLLHDRTISPAAPPGDVCLFYDHHAVDPAVADPLHQFDIITLGIGPSTAASAFQILRLMGFARVLVVGLDGQGGYVRPWSGPFQDHYYRDHREARLECERLARAWSWDVDWSRSGPTPSDSHTAQP